MVTAASAQAWEQGAFFRAVQVSDIVAEDRRANHRKGALASARLPEQLYLPDGTAAFGSWTGGWLGVLGRQIEDVNTFGQAWMSGERSTSAASTF